MSSCFCFIKYLKMSYDRWGERNKPSMYSKFSSNINHSFSLIRASQVCHIIFLVLTLNQLNFLKWTCPPSIFELSIIKFGEFRKLAIQRCRAWSETPNLIIDSSKNQRWTSSFMKFSCVMVNVCSILRNCLVIHIIWIGNLTLQHTKKLCTAQCCIFYLGWVEKLQI